VHQNPISGLNALSDLRLRQEPATPSGH
jgi:hypothetical protein